MERLPITLLARDEWVATAESDAELLCSFVFARVRMEESVD